MNIWGMVVHIAGDALGSVGVIISSTLIQFLKVEWRFYFDPICSIILCMIILYGAAPLFVRSAKVLLLSSPADIHADKLMRAINKLPGVTGVHNFHLWELMEGAPIASLHFRVQPEFDFITVQESIKDFLHTQNIHVSTIQPEFDSPIDECNLYCGLPDMNEADAEVHTHGQSGWHTANSERSPGPGSTDSIRMVSVPIESNNSKVVGTDGDLPFFSGAV